MTVFLLIRHAHVDAVGHSLAGRQSKIHLNEQGVQESQQLASRLAKVSIDRVYSSPLERALETAAPLARERSLAVEPAQELIEFDFGDWTGRSFAELENDARWKPFNSFRSGVQAPHGETMLGIQLRTTEFLRRLQATFPDQSIVLVSHCDVIRAVLCYYLGMPLDFFQRITVDPASVSKLRLESTTATVLSMNERSS